MKKWMSIIALFCAVHVNAQLWFDVGLKGGVGSGFPINSALNDDGRLNVAPGFNYFFGGKVGINYGEFVGVTCDVDYGSYSYGFNQSEVPGMSSAESFKYRFGYNAINVAPLFRFTKEASYLEIGPQFQFGRNPFIEDEAYPLLQPDPTNAIRSNLTGLIFGFGGHFIGNEIISLMMGLRFNYVLSNVASDAYSDTNFPFNNYLDIPPSNKTSPLNVQMVMELNYSLGYIARSTTGCGKRAAFMTF